MPYIKWASEMQVWPHLTTTQSKEDLTIHFATTIMQMITTQTKLAHADMKADSTVLLICEIYT